MILSTDLKYINLTAKRTRKGLYLADLTPSYGGSATLVSDRAPTYTSTIFMVLHSKTKKDTKAIEFSGSYVRPLGLWDGDSSKYSSMSLRTHYEAMGLHFIFASHALGLTSWKVTHILVDPTIRECFDVGIGSCLFQSPVPTVLCRKKTMTQGISVYVPAFHKIAEEG